MSNTGAYEMGMMFGTILALLIPVGLLIFFIVSLVKAITRKSAGWIISAVVSGMLCGLAVLGVIGVAAKRLAEQGKSGATTSSGTSARGTKSVSSKSGTVTLQVPDSWRDLKDLNEVAVIQSGNLAKEQYLIVIENPRLDYAGTLEDFDEMTMENVRNGAPGAVIDEPVTDTVGGCRALRRRIQSTTNNTNIIMYSTQVETRDYLYQIMSWTLKSREESTGPLLKQVTDSFTSTSPAVPADSGSIPPAGKVEQEAEVEIK